MSQLTGRLQLSPTPKVIKQLALIERFTGEWSRFGSVGVFSKELEDEAAFTGAEAALALDSSSPPGISTFIITMSRETDRSPHDGPRTLKSYESSTYSDEIPINRHLEQYLNVFQTSLTLNREGLCSLYNKITGQETPGANFSAYCRKEVDHFRSPGASSGEDEITFPTVSPFLVNQRINELLSWTQNEFQTGQYHPLLVIPLFHLAFLQIHPFPKANHRLAQAVLWHLMNQHGYSFVRYQHLTPIFRARSKAYFAALKQAEKTAGTTWATLNVWFEFFFDATLEATRNLKEIGETLLDETRLTEIQRKILDVLKSRGTASREHLVTETGIVISTLKYNLNILQERGLVKKDGRSRSTHYRIS